MKNIIALLALLILQIPLNGQTKWGKYNAILEADAADIFELSELITKDYNSTREKVEAIYYWVTHNIEYDVKRLAQIKRQNFKRERTSYKANEQRSIDETLNTLKTKKGVCEHFARIFQALCISVDIECEYVVGFVRTFDNQTYPHAWNAVFIDDEWQFVEPTFGAGYINQTYKYITRFNSNYLFCDKEVFNRQHFPFDEEWQLMEDKISFDEFMERPIICQGFIEENIKTITPDQHYIEVVQFLGFEMEFTSNKDISNLKVYRNGLTVPFHLEKNGENFKVSFKEIDLKSGRYLFVNELQPLFIYQLNMI